MEKNVCTLLILFALCTALAFSSAPVTVKAEDYAIVPSVTVSTTDNFSGQQNMFYVFDAEYYAAAYPDVAQKIGNVPEALFAHYLLHGIQEGRNASRNFNLNAYKEFNPDLVEIYGDDPENESAYYTHYLTYGKDEGRIAIYP